MQDVEDVAVDVGGRGVLKCSGGEEEKHNLLRAFFTTHHLLRNADSLTDFTFLRPESQERLTPTG